MEIWKTIDGTNGKYSVSNLGNVRRNEHYTKVTTNNTTDVMMDMYENPGFYFKSVDKGPFSGSTKRIKPLSK